MAEPVELVGVFEVVPGDEVVEEAPEIHLAQRLMQSPS
jgi:hypothetical protein